MSEAVFKFTVAVEEDGMKAFFAELAIPESQVPERGNQIVEAWLQQILAALALAKIGPISGSSTLRMDIPNE